MPANARYSGCSVQVVLPVRRPLALSINGIGPGTGANSLLPTQVTGIISKKTQLATRKGRGRIYPGFPDSGFADADGNMTNAGYGVLGAIAAAWPLVDVVVVGGSSSTIVAEVGNSHYVASEDIILFLHEQMFATQRRRGNFGRKNT
jgi:hypothetical protein